MGSQFSTTLRTNRVGQIGTTLGSGGSLKIYTGSPPGVGNAATGTPLATLGAVTYGSPSGGQQSFTATPDTNAAASGTPGYARLLTSGGTVHDEFDCAVTPSTGTFTFNSAISSGGTVTLTSAVFTDGNA